jgi:hypothetical protein
VGTGEGIGKWRICWKYYVFMYENGAIRPVETVLRNKEGDKGERWRG